MAADSMHVSNRCVVVRNRRRIDKPVKALPTATSRDHPLESLWAWISLSRGCHRMRLHTDWRVPGWKHNFLVMRCDLAEIGNAFHDCTHRRPVPFTGDIRKISIRLVIYALQVEVVRIDLTNSLEGPTGQIKSIRYWQCQRPILAGGRLLRIHR